MGANDIAIVEDIEDFRIGDNLGAKHCLIQGLYQQHHAHKYTERAVMKVNTISQIAVPPSP